MFLIRNIRKCSTKRLFFIIFWIRTPDARTCHAVPPRRFVGVPVFVLKNSRLHAAVKPGLIQQRSICQPRLGEFWWTYVHFWDDLPGIARNHRRELTEELCQVPRFSRPCRRYRAPPCCKRMKGQRFEPTVLPATNIGRLFHYWNPDTLGFP